MNCVLYEKEKQDCINIANINIFFLQSEMICSILNPD